MAVLNEDFHRCACGGADFKKEEIVTLFKNPKKRYVDEQTVELPALSSVIVYICTNCNKKLDK